MKNEISTKNQHVDDGDIEQQTIDQPYVRFAFFFNDNIYRLFIFVECIYR